MEILKLGPAVQALSVERDGAGGTDVTSPFLPQVQEEPEGALCRAPHQLHQSPVEHLQASHQVSMRPVDSQATISEAHLCSMQVCL